MSTPEQTKAKLLTEMRELLPKVQPHERNELMASIRFLERPSDTPRVDVASALYQASGMFIRVAGDIERENNELRKLANILANHIESYAENDFVVLSDRTKELIAAARKYEVTEPEKKETGK